MAKFYVCRRRAWGQRMGGGGWGDKRNIEKRGTAITFEYSIWIACFVSKVSIRL